MDFDATIDLIIKELREAEEILEDLKKYPGIPALQVEFARLKCRSAGEVIALLKTFRNSGPVATTEPAPQKVPAAPDSAPGPTTISPPGISPDAEQRPVRVEKEGVHPVPPEKKTEAVSGGKEVKTGQQEPERKAPKDPESSILADRFSHLSGSFNEQLRNINSKEDLSNIIKTKPVRSLNEAIGINDKFFFIREIFNGDHNEYSQAIARLENIRDIEDARAVIMSYTGDNNETDAIKQLLDLVKRKLPSNE